MNTDIEPTAADRACAEEIVHELWGIGPDWDVPLGAAHTLIARHVAARVAEETAGLRADLIGRLVDAAMTIMHCHPDEVDRKREKMTVAFVRIFSKATEHTP